MNGRGKKGLKNFKNPKSCIIYSEKIDDIYKNLEEYNPTKKRRVLIVFDDRKTDMESNKNISPKVTELFLRGRKPNISLVFISQSYFKVLKTIKLNATLYFIMKIPDRKELQQIASNHALGIYFKDFMKLYKDYTKELYSFFANDTTFPSDNP